MTPPLHRELDTDRTLTSRIPTWTLFVIGGAITLLTGPRWPIAPLAWLAPVAYLVIARRLRGWRGWLGLAGFQILAACVQISVIATPPVPLLGIIGFGPPLAVIWYGATLAGELMRRRAGEMLGIFTFASVATLLSWAGYSLTELGAWMSPSVSQVDQLGFLQLASLGGLPLADFVMTATGATIAMLVSAPAGHRRAAPAIALGAVLALGLGWSALRLTTTPPSRNVIVGAVTTDLGLDEQGREPSPAQLAANTDALFARTRVAAQRGARLVVWNEVATLVEPADEAAFVARARAMAGEMHIDIVLAYAAVTRREPLLLDNKYVFISDAGEVLDTYQKHHPVPGEPSIRGTGPLKVLDRPYARVGAAICYDYDFPAIAREHGERGAELVVVPSSDWRGIDPVHTKMARVRAIENGFSLVRSTRWAASGAFDARGRTHAWMAARQPDFVMLATVPIGRETTLYSIVGDIVVLGVALFLAGAIVFARISSRRGR